MEVTQGEALIRRVARLRTEGHRPPVALSRGRRLAGFGAVVLGLPALTAALHGRGLSLTSDILLFLATVVGVALLGGVWPALLAAFAGSLLLNWYFTPPYGRFLIAEPDNLLALVIFVVVAIAVSWVVDTAARRTRQAAEASADAQTLASVAGAVLRGDRPLLGLVSQLRETFTLQGVVVRQDDAEIVAVGSPGEPEIRVPADDGVVLVLYGRVLKASDRRVVEAFAAQMTVALRQERLSVLAEADRMRTALLAAVSHDLRTPLASAKASVASLRSEDVHFSAADRAELLLTAAESLDRLDRLVTNLLDMSRLQAGALGVTLLPIGAEEVVPGALDDLGPAGRAVVTRIPDDLPALLADPGLLERVLANLVGNAVRYSPPDRPPAITATTRADMMEFRIIDHGPGIPASRWEDIFLPFQRLGDRDNHTGVGLGLALSRGLTESMGGRLTPEETPGGGLTMVLSLPLAPR